MSEKRRDNKNRVLRNGESQRKDGRYRYTYVDADGNQKDFYSWKLEPTDKLPAGKRECKSLREQIREHNKKIAMGLVAQGESMSVIDLVKRYVATKTGVTHNTEAGYKTVIRIIEKEPFGKRRIDSIRVSDARLWLIKLQKKDGRSYSSIHSIRGVVRPAFQMAVDDDILIKNPFEFQLATVVVNDAVMREAISKSEERKFLDFVQNDSHFRKYYEGIFILFKTGLRISEFVGLTVSDLDMKNREINIDHQLQRKRDGTYIIVPTKTEAGTRVLPMIDEVYWCCKKILENRRAPKIEPVLFDSNGSAYSGFLFFDKNEKPMISLHWEHYFKHICQKYNKIYKIQMPKVTPHVCRHTYCSNMARSGMNPKTLQYLMGHSDIGVTLNTYTHLGLEDAKKEVKRIARIS